MYTALPCTRTLSSGVIFAPSSANLAVDFHLPGGDEFFHIAARADAGLRQRFCRRDFGDVRDIHAPSRSSREIFSALRAMALRHLRARVAPLGPDGFAARRPGGVS